MDSAYQTGKLKNIYSLVSVLISKQKEREYQDEKKRREIAEAALATDTRDLATVNRDLATVNGMYATVEEQLAKFEKLANDVFQKK